MLADAGYSVGSCVGSKNLPAGREYEKFMKHDSRFNLRILKFLHNCICYTDNLLLHFRFLHFQELYFGLHHLQISSKYYQRFFYRQPPIAYNIISIFYNPNTYLRVLSKNLGKFYFFTNQLIIPNLCLLVQVDRCGAA